MANLLSTTIDGSITEKEGTGTVSGTTITVDLATGNFFEIDIASATGSIGAITVNNAASSGISTFILKLKQSSTSYEAGVGSTNVYASFKSIKWPSITGFKWENATSAVLSNTLHKADILSFTSYDNGTTWIGNIVGNFIAPNKDILFGSRGIFAGGNLLAGAPDTNSNVIDYVTIGTPGDATDFGNLSVGRRGPAATSNGTRGIFAGGWLTHPTNTYLDTIDYVAIATTGDATDFGNLSEVRKSCSAVSDGVRAVMMGGSYPSGGGGQPSFTIDYITIATTADAADFGDHTVARTSTAGVTDGIIALNPQREIASPQIDKLTIATLGNAVDFGNALSVSRSSTMPASDGHRGLWAGGHETSNVRSEIIDYVTIAISSNAVDFGNLTVSRSSTQAGTSNGSRGIFAGGYGPQGGPLVTQDVIDYVTIATTGDATDFGNLTEERSDASATSGD